MVGTHEAIECRGLRIQMSGSGPVHKLISEVMLQFVHTTKTDLTVFREASPVSWSMGCNGMPSLRTAVGPFPRSLRKICDAAPNASSHSVQSCLRLHYLDLLSRPALPRKLGSCK